MTLVATRSLPRRDVTSSGEVLSRLRTTPEASSLRYTAHTLGLDLDVVEAAVDNYRAGRAVAVVFSGKLACGKDTLAERIALALGEAGRPAEVQRTSDPIRDELDQAYRIVLASLADASRLRAGAAQVEEMGLPAPAADHIVEAVAAHLAASGADPRTTTLRSAERTHLNRDLLVYLADEGRRSVDPQYWTRRFFSRLIASVASGRSVMLTGARYPNEIGPAQALGAFVVRIEVTRETQIARLRARDGLEPRTEALDSENECALDDYVGFNLVVTNDGGPEPTVAVIREGLADHVGPLALSLGPGPADPVA